MDALASSPPDTAARASARARFDDVSQGLHWLSVLLIGALFASAWSLRLARDGGAAGQILTLHRSVGVSLWIVALARLAWRLTFAVRPPLPADMPRPQKAAAAASEAALYVLMLVQPLTGLAQSLTRGRPFQLFVFQAPRAMARHKALTGAFHDIHELGGWLLLSLIGLHVAAALFHGLARRDGVLSSMWPWAARRPHPFAGPPPRPVAARRREGAPLAGAPSTLPNPETRGPRE
jgi:cytochrome b561